MNLILDTDSYKASHHLQYPPGTEAMYSYLESRGGVYPGTIFFGLQYLMKEYLEGSVVTRADVDEAKTFFEAHGEPFPYKGWMHIVNHHNGKLPILIKAVPEGMYVPTSNILMSVESTDPKCFWLVSWLETMFVRMWYPITVATQSHFIKRTIQSYLRATSDTPDAELPFKLHDFGSRGVSSRETAGVGGMAHLVNFLGSDTVEGVRFANKYYNNQMAGFSIPAAEHSTITAWGQDSECRAYRNMLTKFAKPGKFVAVVSDSYDIWNAISEFWCGTLLEKVKASGATVVIRPDSGDPVEIVLKCLEQLEQRVGMTRNDFGYKVLPSYFRLIQGDGVDAASIEEILEAMLKAGYSASNIAFGCGGALLQKLNRDTQKFAFKCSEITVGGHRRDVFKMPVTDTGKTSKRGKLGLFGDDYDPTKCTLSTERLTYINMYSDILKPVFENGQILVNHTLAEVRERADKALP